MSLSSWPLQIPCSKACEGRWGSARLSSAQRSALLITCFLRNPPTPEGQRKQTAGNPAGSVKSFSYRPVKRVTQFDLVVTVSGCHGRDPRFPRISGQGKRTKSSRLRGLSDSS